MLSYNPRGALMSEESVGLVAVAVMRDEARVWNAGIEPGARPKTLHAPSDLARHHHVRGTHQGSGHPTDHDQAAFYDSIADAVESAAEIVVIGHGKGKANEMILLTQYWERKRPDVAHKVIGAIDSDLEALSENQVLALIREWFENYREMN
jgi:hypothetical protein